MKIPFLDLVAQYEGIKEEIKKEIEEVLQSGSFILGEKVERFEEEFARYIGVRFCVGLNSGTSALFLGLKALEIGRGDEVILPSNTFIATYEAILSAGAKPVLVEPDRRTYTLDLHAVERAITRKTKAIIPVHLYGQVAPMKPLLEMARGNHLFLIEDAAQAHGSLFYLERENGNVKGVKAGSLGEIGAFSFYPGKNLGAYGEGGCIVTNHEEVALRVRMLRNHGQREKYFHDLLGGNYRMDSFQGAVLGVKLKYLDSWNEMRRKWASLYNESLSSLDIIPPYEAEYGRHIYHLYVIRVKDRDRLRKFLLEKGIETGIHYPIPIHLQKAYRERRKQNGSFPITETLSREILSLPIYPELTEEKVLSVVNGIQEFLFQKEKGISSRFWEGISNPMELDQPQSDFSHGIAYKK